MILASPHRSIQHCSAVIASGLNRDDFKYIPERTMMSRQICCKLRKCIVLSFEIEIEIFVNKIKRTDKSSPKIYTQRKEKNFDKHIAVEELSPGSVETQRI